MTDHPGGVTLLAINTSRTQPESVAIGKPADRYTLTVQKLEDTQVLLNEKTLALQATMISPRSTACQSMRVESTFRR